MDDDAPAFPLRCLSLHRSRRCFFDIKAVEKWDREKIDEEKKETAEEEPQDDEEEEEHEDEADEEWNVVVTGFGAVKLRLALSA